MKADKVLYKEKENIPKTTCIIRESWGLLCLVVNYFELVEAIEYLFAFTFFLLNVLF